MKKEQKRKVAKEQSVKRGIRWKDSNMQIDQIDILNKNRDLDR